MIQVDLSNYYPLPMLATAGYVSLTTSMLVVEASDPPTHVTTARATLATSCAEARTRLAGLSEDALLDEAFDHYVEQVWAELRERLEFYALYSHPGAAKFSEDDRQRLAYDDRLDRARLAARVLDRMFASGLDWLRSVHPEQATQAVTRVEWLGDKQTTVPLEALVGADLVSLIQGCQTRYLAMIRDRGAADSGRLRELAELRQLRGRLRAHLHSYCGAVGTMLDGGGADAHAIVERILRPILVARINLRRRAGAAHHTRDTVQAGARHVSELPELPELPNWGGVDRADESTLREG